MNRRSNREKFKAASTQPRASKRRARSAAQPPVAPAELQAAVDDVSQARPAALLSLQRMFGNRAVQGLMQRAYAGPEGGELGASLQAELDSARGGGQNLDRRVGTQMGRALGSDVREVKVHTDARADKLNRAMNAEAFTLGSDVFFSRGAYQPNTASGSRLIAHELTHVVQQRGAKPNKAQAKLRVGPASDSYEREADSVAEHVAQPGASPIGVQVQGSLPANRISTKKRLMHLDFVLMKRQDAQIKRIIKKALGMKVKAREDDDTHGTMGHYWTEIGRKQHDGAFRAQKSYGWYPKDDVGGIKSTFKGVEGALNGDDSDHDPHEGDPAETEFYPSMEVDPEKEGYDNIRDRVVGEIDSFANGFSGTWNWRLGWGKNCQTFQDKLKTKVGLHNKKAKGWLIDPHVEEEKKEAVEKQVAQEKVKEEEHVATQEALASVIKTLTFPVGNMTMEGYKEDRLTPADPPIFKIAPGGVIRASGKEVGATGVTKMGKTGFQTNRMCEFVIDNERFWMAEAWWEMYFNEPYPVQDKAQE